MPMTKEQSEALKAYTKASDNYTQAALSLGIPRSTLRDRVKTALKWKQAPKGQLNAVETTGLDITGASHGWIKTGPDDNGIAHSVFWKQQSDPEAQTKLIEHIAEQMNEKVIQAPMVNLITKHSNQDLMSVFPVADLHVGLLTCEEEVGVDWDTKIATNVFKDSFGDIVSRTEQSHTAVLAQLGDLTHTNDQNNVTPGHKHQLDADSRWFLINRRAVEAMKTAIDMLRSKYPQVIYRGSRGNHDTDAHIGITSALYERYYDVPEVTIDITGMDFFTKKFGNNLIITHHGDKVKPERMATFIPEQFRKLWGETKECTVYSGHVHHRWSKEIGGIFFQGCGTIIPRDAHAFSNGYSSQRTLTSDTYHFEDGKIESKIKTIRY